MTTKSIDWFVHHVEQQLGQHEHPLGSNREKYGEQFGWNGVSWCCEFGWCMYSDAGVVLPIKSASCVAIYDACVRDGLHYTSDHCVPGDAVIRTWQRLARHAPGFDPEQTHFQIVVAVKHTNARKYLGLLGGNQGAGYVGPAVEWVPAGDATILGGLAFHRLFRVTQPAPAKHNPAADAKHMPAVKSHRYPRVGGPAGQDARDLSRRLKGKQITGKHRRATFRRLRDRITHALHKGRKS